MSHLSPERRLRAERTIALYPEPRSALIPLCHLAQEQDGYLSPPAMEEIASLIGVTPAEVLGTASFYDMLHTSPVGTYLVSVCTNIACLLAGGDALLRHAEETLGIAVGETTPDGLFTLEDAECLADCDVAPCVQVNHRYVRTTSSDALDELLDTLRLGGRTEEIPRHGTLIRVERNGGLRAPAGEIAAERAAVRLEIHARSDEGTSA